MYQFIPLKCGYLCETSRKANDTTDEAKNQNETWILKKQMKFEWLYKAGSKSKMNLWPDSSVGWSAWVEFSGRGFKCLSDQLSYQAISSSCS